MSGIYFVRLLLAQCCPTPRHRALLMLLPLLLQLLPPLHYPLAPTGLANSCFQAQIQIVLPSAWSYCLHLCSHNVHISITIIITVGSDLVKSRLMYSSLYPFMSSKCWAPKMVDPFMWPVQERKIHTGSRLVVARGWVKGGQRMTVKWVQGFLLGYRKCFGTR